MTTKICIMCNTEFSKPYYCSNEVWHKRKYCSIKCSCAAKIRLIEVTCKYCGNNILKKPSLLGRRKNFFCCKKCYNKYVAEILPFNKQNAYKGVRGEDDSRQIYHKNYCHNHPDNIAHLKARRYAREKGASGSHTLGEWIALKEKFYNKCAICGSIEKLTKDHIIPLSKGGTDFIENIQPLCKSCNSKKHNKIYVHDNPELLSNQQNAQ